MSTWTGGRVGRPVPWAQDRELVRDILKIVMEALSPARLHFGWRVIEEVVRFMEQRQEQNAGLSVNDALGVCRI